MIKIIPENASNFTSFKRKFEKKKNIFSLKCGPIGGFDNSTKLFFISINFSKRVPFVIRKFHPRKFHPRKFHPAKIPHTNRICFLFRKDLHWSSKRKRNTKTKSRTYVSYRNLECT